MDPYGDPAHSFPRTNGGPQARRNGPHPRRGPRRRLPRPPAMVRIPLAAFQHSSVSSFTTNTTSRSSHIQHHNRGTLQPITRFCHPQDNMSLDAQSTSVMDNQSSRDVLLLLQAASGNQREEVFWGICLQMYELFMQHPAPLQSHWFKNILSRQFPGPQSDLVLYNTASRYHRDFEEEEELGHGGFGRVVRARNKLDGLHYAIKMIIMEDNGESSLDACVSEVRALAQLDHPRVVRYYTAWVQQDVWSQQPQWTSATVRELSSDSRDDSSAESSSENSASPHLLPACQVGNIPLDDSVVFQDTGTREVEVQPPSRSTHSIQQWPSDTQNHAHPEESGGASGPLLPYMSQPQAQPKKIVYIQMKLYGQSLRKWMDERNSSESPVVVERECLGIFRQVVEAMCYIHQQGYMHRDIKPANILFSLTGGDVLLGDFGLARPIAHLSPAAPHTNLTPQTYSLNVGTPLYTAPEVKEGNYCEKSDMYSLGIILVELFMPFKTDFERSVVIKNLKANDDLDPNLMHHWPSIAYWIKKLADKDPANRPSAKELLESTLFLQPQPPPSPTTTSRETDAGGFSRQGLTCSPQAAATTVEFTRSEFTSVNTVELYQTITEESVNHTVHIEERLSKDEQIAVLKEENCALKRMVEVLKRDLQQFQINNATQAAEY